jgi:hypothetical protein
VWKASEQGWISLREFDRHYYRHPNFTKDYVRIMPRENYTFDWERDTVAKGPRLLRFHVKLGATAARQLEIQEKIRIEQAIRQQMGLAPPNFDVFLSYSSRSSSEAKSIADLITSASGKVFMAEKSVEPGENFEDRIRDAISGSQEVWILLTPDSLSSDWVASEWGAAWVLRKSIIPIILRCEIKNLPIRYQRLQCIDFHRIGELVARKFPKKA